MSNQINITKDGLEFLNDSGRRVVIRPNHSASADTYIDLPTSAGTISTGGGDDGNDAVKVSANDTTAGYLNGKLVAGSGITFTENNNGGNETLTIAAAAAPVTSVNTKTGAVTLTNTDVGAAATSHTHAASDITSGTIATVRLGSGTADSTTFLRGDNTWAVPNGGGGGSSDITYYTASLADCENTTSKTNLISATIPANTWSDGDQVTLKIAGDLTTNLASSSLTMGVEGTGFGPYTRSANVQVGSDPNRFTAEFRFMRNGAGLYYYVGGSGTWSESPYLDIGLATLLIGSFGAINSVSDDWLVFDSSVDFTTNITLAITSQWGTAGAGIWIRPFWGNAYKEKGTAL